MTAPVVTIIDPTHIAIDGEVLPVITTEQATEITAVLQHAEERIAREKEAAA